MKPILKAVFIIIICAFILETTAQAGGASTLKVLSTTPKSPVTLVVGEKMIVAIRYKNNEPNPVRIFARPALGKMVGSETFYNATPGAPHMHGSPDYMPGSGEIEGWFYLDEPAFINEVRVEMMDWTSKRVVATAKLPIRATWTKPKQATPASLATTPKVATGSAPVAVGENPNKSTVPPAGKAEPASGPKFATVAEAQKAAIQRNPELGVVGSKLNLEFVTQVKVYQQTRPEFFIDPSWPIRLVEELRP